MTLPLFLLPRDEGKPYYLAEASAGKDAGSSVDYRFEIETGPIGNRDVVTMLRQLAASLRGTAKFEIDVIVDGRTAETLVVYMQVTTPTSPSTGDYWVDLGSSPYELSKYDGSAWKLLPDKARSAGKEIDVELPVAYRAELVSLKIRTVVLIGDFSVGSWAAGVRPVKARE